MRNVYLAGSVRTPIGRFGGTLAQLTAADLGVVASPWLLCRNSLAQAFAAQPFGNASTKANADVCAGIGQQQSWFKS